MFAYQIMSEYEAMQERFQLLKEGEYDAVVNESQDKLSSSGNPMMDMTVTLWDSDGKQHDIRDFLVFTTQMMWKIIHFANSAGILEEYEAGKLCSQVAINKHVRVKVTIEQGKEIPVDKLNGKTPGSKYPDKNKIEDYIKKEDQKPLEANGSDFDDKDVPF